jgi:hypothetical protein
MLIKMINKTWLRWNSQISHVNHLKSRHGKWCSHANTSDATPSAMSAATFSNTTVYISCIMELDPTKRASC